MGAPLRLLASLVLAGRLGRSLAATANVAGLFDVTWTTNLQAGKVTFDVQALQPAGCAARRSGRSTSAPSGPAAAFVRARLAPRAAAREAPRRADTPRVRRRAERSG
jgi:hypothetical protein